MGYSAKEASGLVRGARGNASALPGRSNAASQSSAAGSNNAVAGARNAAAQAGGIVPTFTLPGTGDGIGDGKGHKKATGASAGGLMGANAGLAGYAAEGSRYGLHVSSGARPGAITTSGNVSLHASGNAIDLAGDPSSMLSYAKYEASTHGSGLDELIHTPLGFGIKNGKQVPLSFWGSAINAQHHDHVHVGDRTPDAGGGGIGGLGGALGGGGFGLPPSLNLDAPTSGVQGAAGAVANAAMAAMTKGLEDKINGAIGGGAGGLGLTPGKGGALSFEQVAKLAESVGLPGVTFAQIAKGESGFNPSAIGHDPGGTRGLGLWQITTKYNDDIIKMLGGEQAMLNPQINAQAAKMIYDRQGIKAWYGTKYLTDPNAHFTGDGIGWGGAFAEGGSMRVRKPTLFLAGDRGEEHVRVQRSTQRAGGNGRRRGGGVVINGMVIHNHRAGDIEEQIREEVDRAFASLGDEMDANGVENEDALL
jgi:hypothetical protein